MEFDYVQCLDHGLFSLQYYVICTHGITDKKIHYANFVTSTRQLHNIYGPAHTSYRKGTLKVSMYHVNNKLHNEYGIARMERKSNGIITKKEYWILDEPCSVTKNDIMVIKYDTDNNCIGFDYHRLHLPPKYTPNILYKENGQYFRVRYWRSGRFIDPEEIPAYNRLAPAIFIGVIALALKYKLTILN